MLNCLLRCFFKFLPRRVVPVTDLGSFLDWLLDKFHLRTFTKFNMIKSQQNLSKMLRPFQIIGTRNNRPSKWYNSSPWKSRKQIARAMISQFHQDSPLAYNNFFKIHHQCRHNLEPSSYYWSCEHRFLSPFLSLSFSFPLSSSLTPLSLSQSLALSSEEYCYLNAYEIRVVIFFSLFVYFKCNMCRVWKYY